MSSDRLREAEEYVIQAARELLPFIKTSEHHIPTNNLKHWLRKLDEALTAQPDATTPAPPPVYPKAIANSIVAMLSRNNILVGAFWQQIHDIIAKQTEPYSAARELPPAAPPAQVSEATKLELVKPDDMIDWLNALNSNWSVCRNTRSFKEGQPSEYWKKFDKEMGYAFKLQVALMKLRSPASTSGKESRDGH